MDDQSKSIENFHFSYSLDRKHFFRRACSKCGLEFKTKADPNEIANILQSVFSPLGLEIGESPNKAEDKDEVKPLITCPYCGHPAETSDVLTHSFSKYLERFILREVMLPRINNLFEEFADSVGNHRSKSGSFISFEFSVEFNRSLYPPRPIAGPEPPDMKIIDLICCRKQIKILDNWNCEVICPFCSGIAVLQ